MSVSLDIRAGDHYGAVRRRLETWASEGLAGKVWSKDRTAWFSEPRDELTNRLGWLDLPEAMGRAVTQLEAFGAEVQQAGIRDVVVLGMGGSSLAPEVFARVLGRPDRPRLRVLDSTHPATVAAIGASLDLERSLFIVSSKSGTTIETTSFFRYFWSAVSGVSNNPGYHFVAVTDRGTPLAELAAERSFLRTFEADPDVGGRYSALTHFGLVPAALVGADLAALLSAAASVAGTCRATEDNPGLELGATLGELARAGIDKVTMVTGEDLAALPPWIEQLIAESTGKEGRGIVPISGEEPASPDTYSDDRFFVGIDSDGSTRPLLDEMASEGHPVCHVGAGSPADLAGVMFLFEMAIAAAGAAIEINPFDQPDVQLAKTLATRAMEGKLDLEGVEAVDATDDGLRDAIGDLVCSLGEGDYFCIQAFLAEHASTEARLEAIRRLVQVERRVATAVDYGPRFLHSTGQLHKGGSNEGVFLQLVDDPKPVIDVPETDFSFGKLVTAQAIGDHKALLDRDRRVLSVSLGADVEVGLSALTAAIEAAVAG
jgi:transaldolase / glucose-6-phosphate isomerase